MWLAKYGPWYFWFYLWFRRWEFVERVKVATHGICCDILFGTLALAVGTFGIMLIIPTSAHSYLTKDQRESECCQTLLNWTSCFVVGKNKKLYVWRVASHAPNSIVLNILGKNFKHPSIRKWISFFFFFRSFCHSFLQSSIMFVGSFIYLFILLDLRDILSPYRIVSQKLLTNWKWILNENKCVVEPHVF